MDNNEPVTPESIKSLVRDLKDLRDRVAKKETEMDAELTKFREASKKLQKDLGTVLELKRELQDRKRETNSKSESKASEKKGSPHRSRSPRKSRSPHKSHSPRKSRSPHKSRSPRKSHSPRRSRSPRRRSRTPRESSNNNIERFEPSFSPSPTRHSGDSSPDHISRERKRTLNTGSESFHIAGNYMFKTRVDRCYVCGKMGHSGKVCWFR